MTATPRSGSIVRALIYAAVRDASRRIRRLARKPIRLVLLVGLIGGLGVLQVGAIVARGDAPVGSPAGAVAGLAAVLCLGVVTAVRRSPVRLRPGDVAWLVPSPRGPRSLLAWHLGTGAARLAVFGTLAGLVAMLRAGEVALVALQPAVALTALALFLRGVAFLTHVATTRGVPAMLAAAATIAVIAPAALPWAWAARSDTTPAMVSAAAAVPGVVLGPLLAAIRGPDPALWGPVALACTIAVAIAVTVVALGSRYQDEAAHRAWERASVAAAYQDGSPLAAPIQELVAARLPSNVSSFTALGHLTGERALLWRAVANLRRSWRWDLRPTAVMAAVATVLAVFAPTFALAPLGAMLLLSLPGFRSGVVGELEHLAIRTIPGRPVAKLVAADLLPVGLLAAELSVVAVPGLVAAGRSVGEIGALVVATPGVAAVGIASASWIALVVPTLGRRIACSAAVTGGVYALLAGLGAAMWQAHAPLRWLAGITVLLAGMAWSAFAWRRGGRELGRTTPRPPWSGPRWLRRRAPALH